MEISDIKRWQWALIGLALGALAAWIRVSMVDPDDFISGAPSDNQLKFEQMLIRTLDEEGNVRLRHHVAPTTGPANPVAADVGKPMIKNVIVYPEEHNTRFFITYDILQENPDGKSWTYKSHVLHGANPYVPSRRGLSRLKGFDRPDWTIQSVLAEVQKEYPGVTYREAWTQNPKIIYPLWMGSGLVIIGGIWPTLLNFLIGAGFGPPKKKKDDYDLERFTPEPAAPAAIAVDTKADDDALEVLNQELEDKLRREAEDEEDAVPVVPVFAATPFRVLNAAPLEEVEVSPAAIDADDKAEVDSLEVLNQKMFDKLRRAAEHEVVAVPVVPVRPATPIRPIRVLNTVPLEEVEVPPATIDEDDKAEVDSLEVLNQKMLDKLRRET